MEDEIDEDASVRQLEIDTDRNMELICQFLDHLKSEANIDIPEEHFLSFFNA